MRKQVFQHRGKHLIEILLDALHNKYIWCQFTLAVCVFTDDYVILVETNSDEMWQEISQYTKALAADLGY